MAIGGFGLGLANLGAIAGGLQAYRAQDAEIQRALAQLATEQRRQRLFEQQQATLAGFGRAAMDPAFANVFGTPPSGAPGAVSGPDYSPGAVQAQPLAQPIPPGAVQAQPIPSVPSYGPSGGMPTDAQLNFARQAIARGYPPAAAAGMAGSMVGESGPNLDPYALNPTSGALGRAQWLGSRKAGLLAQPDPYSPQTQDRYLFSELAGPEAATGRRMMGETDPRQAARDFTTGFERPGPGSTAAREVAAARIYDQLDGAQQKEAQQGAIRTATMIPPQFAGRLNLPQLAQIVNRTSPGASDEVKGAILGQLLDVATPLAKMQFEQGWEQYKFAEGQKEKKQEFDIREREIEAQHRETRARDLETARHHLAMEAGGAGGEKLGIGKNYEITDKETGQSRIVFAREPKAGAGLTDAMTGQPVQFDPAKEEIKEITPSSAQGGRAGAQYGRQLVAGGEVAADLENIGDMPLTASTGYFGGLVGESGGISLLNALKIDMANQLTDTDDINMKIALGGLGRELSTLMSPVYGGEWASKQLEPMIPKANYSIDNALYGIARIKQSAVVALDGFKKSPIPSKEQKDLADEYIKKINKDIPWDVKDVIAYRRQKNPQVTFGEFAKKSGVTGASARGATKYQVGQIIPGKDGRQYVVTGGDLNGDPDVEPVGTAPIPR